MDGQSETGKRLRLDLKFQPREFKFLLEPRFRTKRPSSVQVEVIYNREQAIQHAISTLTQAECLLIAGKGHENKQIIGNNSTPFDDYEIAKKYVC